MKILKELITQDENKKFGFTAIIATIYNELGEEEKTFEYLTKHLKLMIV